MIQNYTKYIVGDEFHNGLRFKINTNKLIFRNNYLQELVTNKKILHIGFVDHLPLMDEKIRKKSWLHAQLIEAASKCVGIDINEKGVQHLKVNYGIDNIYSLDIINDVLPKEITEESFDFLLLPDVIEHIGDPVSFLAALKNKFPNVKKIIITTPNALRLNNFKFALKNTECINSDHRFWFTPYTITKILNDSGYKVTNILFAEHSRISRRQLIKKLILVNKPLLRDNLIIEAV